MSIVSCSIEGCERPKQARGWCRMHYLRWYQRGTTDNPVEHKDCKECGTAISASNLHGPRPKYCSMGCAKKASAITRNPEKYEAQKAKKRAANAAKPRPISSCLTCGISFETRSASFKFCSSKCSNKHLDTHNPIRCSEPDCDRGARGKGLCAMHWRRKARAEGRELPDPWSERRKAHYHKRRAQKLGTQVEDIRPIDIFERDIWLCGLCSTPVDPDLSHPDPMSPSLDHILPLSKGGTHTYENVQLAHLTCNVSKGNRVAA